MKKIFEAYKGILYFLFFIIAAAAAIIFFGFIIVTPLWALAAKYKSFYTTAVFVIAAILFICYLVNKLRKKQLHIKNILNFIFRFILILIAAFLLFSAVLLANNGFYMQSIFIATLIFLISGVIKVLFFKQKYHR